MATGYPAAKGAGRLRGQGPHLDHPDNRTALTRRRAELLLVEVHVNGESVQRQHLQDDDPARASFLLGLSEAELSRISKESGLGHVERAGNQEETYFTYEELQRICVLAAHQMQTVH